MLDDTDVWLPNSPRTHLSSWFVALFGQKQVVEPYDNTGKVSELHEVRSDDVDPVNPWPLSLNPGHDGWQVSRATSEKETVIEGKQDILCHEIQFKLKKSEWCLCLCLSARDFPATTVLKLLILVLCIGTHMQTLWLRSCITSNTVKFSTTFEPPAEQNQEVRMFIQRW